MGNKGSRETHVCNIAGIEALIKGIFEGAEEEGRDADLRTDTVTLDEYMVEVLHSLG